MPDDGSDEPKRAVCCRTAYLFFLHFSATYTDEFQAANEVLENLVDFEHQLWTKYQVFFFRYESRSLYVNRQPLKYLACVLVTAVNWALIKLLFAYQISQNDEVDFACSTKHNESYTI